MPRTQARIPCRDRLSHALRLRLTALLAGALVASCAPFPEAALTQDEPLAAAAARIERAAGLAFGPEGPLAADAPEARADFEVPAGRDGVVEAACFEMFRGGPSDVPAARAVTGREPGVREGELARSHALARALLARHGASRTGGAAPKGRAGQSRDRAEALLALAAGAGHFLTLEASIAPAFGFDGSAAPLLRMHRDLTEQLLLDPDGAPAELLAEGDLPSAERAALLQLLDVSGLERRRRILRTFAGARLVQEGRDRLGGDALAVLLADPPVSSEQLLHPELYFDRDDPPLAAEKPQREGLAGKGFQHVASDVAGEFGLFHALEGVLPRRVAAAAAEGWDGDLLSCFRQRTTGASAFCWRIEFEDRFEAAEAEAALAEAARLHYGGRIVETPEGGRKLEGGSVPVELRRRFQSLAAVLGGDGGLHPEALEQLLAEAFAPIARPARGGDQDPPFRGLRLAASPLFYDAPGRFDVRSEALYGFLFTHRTWPSSADHRFFNVDQFPLAFGLLPEEASGLFWHAERSPLRNDDGFLFRSIRNYHGAGAGGTRLWTPVFSRQRTPEFSGFGVLYGLLFERGSGAGVEEFSPRPLFSMRSEQSGRDRRFGALFDLLSWRTRAGQDRRAELLPGGAGLRLVLGEEPAGFDFGLLFDALHLRRRSVVAGSQHVSADLLWGLAARWTEDDAAGTARAGLGAGFVYGLESTPRSFSTGVVRILGRSLLGFGDDDGRGWVDVLFLRFGGE